MPASARQMRPVMLELGGKSPSILLRDVDAAALVPTLRTAVLWNAGQSRSTSTADAGRWLPLLRVAVPSGAARSS
jgi:acyl-CoA reductase-like NAD-dependent aldehyde dehydrogenase